MVVKGHTTGIGCRDRDPLVSKGDDRGETGGSDEKSRVVRDGAGTVLAALRSWSRSVQHADEQAEERAAPAKKRERCQSRSRCRTTSQTRPRCS